MICRHSFEECQWNEEANGERSSGGVDGEGGDAFSKGLNVGK